jgi:hypothetical protein
MCYYKDMYKYYKYLSIFIIIFFFNYTLVTFASSTDGTIDSVERYAWIESAGWLDFGDTDGNVHVTNSGLTGYAWGENIGWVSLNCSNNSSCGTVDYGVDNTDGTLSGYAWGENTGWIDFDPDGGGVIINSSGLFTGYAWSENLGWVSFNITKAAQTDWRPSSGGSSGSSGGGSSSGSKPHLYTDPLIPTSNIPLNSETIIPTVSVINNHKVTSTGKSEESVFSNKPKPSVTPNISKPNIKENNIPKLPPVAETSEVFSLLGILAGAFLGLRFLFTSIASFSDIALAPTLSLIHI